MQTTLTKVTMITVAAAIGLFCSSANALTAERWQEIQQYSKDEFNDVAYRPKTGDICFVVNDDVAWTTPASRDYWIKRDIAEHNRREDLKQTTTPDKTFLNSVVASNAELVSLDRGIRVKVLDGQPDHQGIGFIGMSGKIQILCGPHAGKTCFSNGVYLKKRVPPDDDSFAKTEEEKKALIAINTATILKEDVNNVLRLNGIAIDAPAFSIVAKPTGEKIRINDPKAPTVQEYPQFLHATKDEVFQWCKENNLNIHPTESSMKSSGEAYRIEGFSAVFPQLKSLGALDLVVKDNRVIDTFQAVSGNMTPNVSVQAFTESLVRDFGEHCGKYQKHEHLGDHELYFFEIGDSLLELGVYSLDNGKGVHIFVACELASRAEVRTIQHTVNGTMPADWKPKLMCLRGEVPIPFGQSLSEFSQLLKQNRFEVEEGKQTDEMRSWVAPTIGMDIPGWGVARGIKFDFTSESGEWVLKDALVVRAMQTSPEFLKMAFKSAKNSLSSCFGQPEVTEGKAIWNKDGYFITLAASGDEANIGYSRDCALLLAFTRK